MNNIDVVLKVFNIMFKKLGREEGITKEEVRITFANPYMKFWNKFFPDLTKEEQDRLYDEAIHQIEDAQLYEGVKETLEYLHSLKINLFVVSSDPKSKLIPEAKQGEVFHLFKDILCRVHEKEDGINDVVKRHKLIPKETMYVGDTSGDVEAGKRAGVKTVGIPWGYQTEDLLRQSNPDFLIHDISELKDVVKS